mgnify:CR=1 FL=1
MSRHCSLVSCSISFRTVSRWRLISARRVSTLIVRLDGADFQVGYKGIDDVPLFLGAAQHKIDGYYLDDLDIAVVLRVDDAVFNFGIGR